MAASIGDNPFQVGFVQFVPGGSGTVTVNGTASKWNVVGTLQVGGFVDNPNGTNSLTDLDGTASSRLQSSRLGRAYSTCRMAPS